MDRTLPDTFHDTRDALRRVAVHIVARARQQATGRFGLRVTPGGFGTPEFGPDLSRIRVSGGVLVRESGGPDGGSSAAVPIHGSTLVQLAEHAGVDLSAGLDVGHDTPDLGDPAAAIAVDATAARLLAEWYATVAGALDRVVSRAGPAAMPTLVQLWPEHFDAALDLAATPDRRVNLGGSPGDGFHADPYLYVGPWTDHRPGDHVFWNAPFGAVLARESLSAAVDPVETAVAFFERGLTLLTT